MLFLKCQSTATPAVIQVECSSSVLHIPTALSHQEATVAIYFPSNKPHRGEKNQGQNMIAQLVHMPGFAS